MASSMPTPLNQLHMRSGLLALLCTPLFALACTGTIEGSGHQSSDAPGASGNAAGAGAAATSGANAAGRAGSAGAAGAPSGDADVGRVGIHRLNNLEYDNTVRDLLGVSSTPASSFIADEKALGFDNIADVLGMTEAQYEQYFSAADSIVDAAFADSALRGRIMTCTTDDAECTERIVRSFGARAWRRPLVDAEVAQLTALASDARDLGEPFQGAIAQVVKALLSSAPFLYRLELDPDPDSGAAHALDAYELASRLSYLVWSTMPDQALFDAAGSGELLGDAALSAQLES